jgi:hypothetical protein
MISSENITALTRVGLQYIVGARVANLPVKLIEAVNVQLFGLDGSTVRLQTKYGELIC